MNFPKTLGIATIAGLLLAACSAAPEPGGALSETEPLTTDAAAVTRNALTPAQSSTVLKLIDDICGDTWCSGDYDFRFLSLTCGTAREECRLGLRLIPRAGVSSPRASYRRSCTTAGFVGFDSLVTTAPNGYQSLDQDYYMALTDCISALEADLP